MVLVVICLNVHPLHTDVPSAKDHMGPLNVVGQFHQQASQIQPTINHSQPHPLWQPPPACQSLPVPPACSSYSPVTPIDPQHLLVLLEGCTHVQEIYLGFKHGFQIPHVPSPWKHPIRNHASVLQNPSFMGAYVAKESTAGRIVGPFSTLLDHYIDSSLGLVPKHEPGSFRVIHDLSVPKGRG